MPGIDAERGGIPAAAAIARAREGDLPLVLIREMTPRGGTELFIYGKDHDHVFATTTRVLDQLGLTIMDARIIRSPGGYSLDTYKVATFGERVEDIFYITDPHDRPVADPLKLECLRYSITTTLAHP